MTNIKYPTLYGGMVDIHINAQCTQIKNIASTIRNCIDTLGLNDISIQIDVYDCIPDMFGDTRQRTQNGYVIRVCTDDCVKTIAHEMYHVYQMAYRKPVNESHAMMFGAWYTNHNPTFSRWENTNGGETMKKSPCPENAHKAAWVVCEPLHNATMPQCR